MFNFAQETPLGQPSLQVVPKNDHQPISYEDFEIAVEALETGESATIDDVPAELVQAGRETMINVLTKICNKISRIK